MASDFWILRDILCHLSAPQKGVISFAFSGIPTMTPEKPNGKNYFVRYYAIDVWFLGQGFC